MEASAPESDENEGVRNSNHESTPNFNGYGHFRDLLYAMFCVICEKFKTNLESNFWIGTSMPKTFSIGAEDPSSERFYRRENDSCRARPWCDVETKWAPVRILRTISWGSSSVAIWWNSAYKALSITCDHETFQSVKSHFLLHRTRKILLKKMWRSGVGWDGPIVPTNRDFLGCQRWAKLLPVLNRLQIPRCCSPNYERGSYGSLQLHIHVDASVHAYCSVAYFYIIDHGAPRCSLVTAKATVTPLCPQSIPRNKLNAIVINVRLMINVVENYSL